MLLLISTGGKASLSFMARVRHTSFVFQRMANGFQPNKVCPSPDTSEVCRKNKTKGANTCARERIRQPEVPKLFASAQRPTKLPKLGGAARPRGRSNATTFNVQGCVVQEIGHAPVNRLRATTLRYHGHYQSDQSVARYG